MENLVFVGMIISLIGVFAYIREMLKGKVKPNRITWLLWTIVPLIAAFAAVEAGSTLLSTLPVFMSGFGPLLVLIISFFKKEAYWKISRLDILCGIVSLLALILWYITKNPNLAIILSIVTDFMAAIPTFIKSYKYPETESSSAYISSLLSVCTSYFAIKNWNFASVAFPTYLVIANIVLTLLIERKRISKFK